MESRLTNLKTFQAKHHPFCLLCSGSGLFGPGLVFEAGENGDLKATFHPTAGLQGYEGVLHGGMTASVLDCIMTNCLFTLGIVAFTAELRVRYREPVAIGTGISLRAWVEQLHPPLFFMRAELVQEGCVRATASAKFMKRYE